MIKGKTTVKNKSGLHLRPASELAAIAGKLGSKITLVAGDKTVDPRSILILMGAGIRKGTEVEIICEGDTEEEDLKIMLDAIDSGFGEGIE